MMGIKNLALCLLAVSLMGDMAMPVYAMEKESPAPFGYYSSYAPGEEVPEEDNLGTEDAPDFKEPQINGKAKISKKNQKSIQNICNYFSDYLGYSMGRKKIGESLSLNFKELKNRKKVLGFMPDLLYTRSLEEAAKFIFGKKASGTITVNYVDWGDNKNIIKIKNIKAKGSKRYEVKFDLVYYDSLKNAKTKFANGVFYLRKTGKYTYIVTKLKAKKTKDIL